MESLLQDPFKDNLKVPPVSVRGGIGASSSSSVVSEELPFDLYNVYVEDVSSSVASQDFMMVQRSSSFTHERSVLGYLFINQQKK